MNNTGLNLSSTFFKVLSLCCVAVITVIIMFRPTELITPLLTTGVWLIFGVIGIYRVQWAQKLLEAQFVLTLLGIWYIIYRNGTMVLPLIPIVSIFALSLVRPPFNVALTAGAALSPLLILWWHPDQADAYWSRNLVANLVIPLFFYLLLQRVNTINNQLKAALELAEQANLAKGNFLANMSHEIRTPLNWLYGSIQLIKESPTDEKLVKEASNMALSGFNTVQQLLDDLFDVSKIAEGKLDYHPQPLALKSFLENLLAPYEKRAQTQGVDFSVDTQILKDGIYRAFDPQRVAQILNHLLSNAFKFTARGSISVVATAVSGSEVVLEVKDTGEGIPDEFKDKLFLPFEQVNQGRLSQHRGAGLGLIICKSIIDSMDGIISIESSEGQGTTATITLPLPVVSIESTVPSDINPIEDEVQKINPNALMGCKILLAEDDELAGVVFRQTIEFLGGYASVVSNGEEALREVAKHDFDLIFLDIHMPRMNGIEALQRLREMGDSSPVIAFTADTLDGNIGRFISLGFDDVLAKPYTMNDLVYAAHLRLNRPLAKPYS